VDDECLHSAYLLEKCVDIFQLSLVERIHGMKLMVVKKRDKATLVSWTLT
jgi:hypothetical protein